MCRSNNCLFGPRYYYIYAKLGVTFFRLLSSPNNRCPFDCENLDRATIQSGRLQNYWVWLTIETAAIHPRRLSSCPLPPPQSSPLSTIYSQDDSETALPKSAPPKATPLLTAGQLQKQWSTTTSQQDDTITELESPYPGSIMIFQSSTFSINDGSRSPLAASPQESSLLTLPSSSSLPLAVQQSSGSGVLPTSSATNSSPWPGIWKLITVVSYQLFFWN